MSVIDGLKAAWSWLNDERDLELADQAVEALEGDLLPPERVLVAAVHLLFAVLAYFVFMGALMLITMLVLAPALKFQQLLLIIPGALPAPAIWAAMFKARRLLMAWVLRSIAARVRKRAVAVLGAITASGSPVGVPVAVDRTTEPIDSPPMP